MKKESDLFALIHSLTGHEKRYFKIYASKHVMGEKNNYLKLFDFLCKQKEYEEEDVLDYFKKEKFVKHLFAVKYYLYNLILKSILDFHSQSSIDIRLNEMLGSTELLYNKALYKQCSKLLQKAKELAVSNEKDLHLLAISELERKIMHREITDIVKSEKQLESIQMEREKALHRYSNFLAYLFYSDTLYFKRRQMPLNRELSRIKDIDALAKKSLLRREGKALSLQAKIEFNHFHFMYYQSQDDVVKMQNHVKRNIELYRSRPDIIKDRPFGYLIQLYHYCLCCFRLQKYNETFPIFEEIKSLNPRKWPFLDAYIRTDINLLELTAYTNTGEFRKATETAKKTNENLIRFSGKIGRDHEVMFYYRIAYAYFGNNEYGEALKWVNNLLNMSKTDLREDLQGFARILNLIIHYEIGNVDLLEYQIRSTYRFLRKKNKLYQFETIILNATRKLPPGNRSKELILFFDNLRKKLVPLLKDPQEKNAFEYIDIISWLESKIKKRSFAEIVKEKVLRLN